MANIAWSAFLADFLIEVPGVSNPLAERVVREAAIEFCRKSGAWVHQMDAVPVVAGQAVYDWDIPEGSVVHRPLEVWCDGLKLEPITSAELSAVYGDWSAQTGTPTHYLSEGVDGELRQVTLSPTPAASILPGLTARLALKPTRAAADLPEVLFEDYGRQIAQGALARLYMQVLKPWSNPKMGEKCERDFELAIARASLRTARGNTAAPLRVRTQHGIG